MNDARALDLVRLRLLVRGKQRDSQLASSLLPFFSDMTAEQWRDEWTRLLGELRRGGDVERESLALTSSGTARALASIGLATLPARASFRSLVRGHLLGRALGLEDERSRKRARSADGLRAIVLGRTIGLGAPTLKQAVDALVWRALGMEPDVPLTLGKLRERVLARELGDGRATPVARSIRIAAAKAAGAPRTETEALVEAVVRRWLAEPAPASASSIALFARDVLEAARDPATRRFTSEKAFIESVWQRARDRGRAVGDLDAFKKRLLEAHRERLLVLSRADLTQLIDPQELAASAVDVDGAAFHFVRTDLPEAAQ